MPLLAIFRLMPESRRPSDFGSLLERVGHLDQPGLVAPEPAEDYPKGDSLLAVPSRHGDAGIAADGEDGGEVVVGHHDGVQPVLFKRLLQADRGQLVEPPERSPLRCADAAGLLGRDEIGLPKIFKPLLQREVVNSPSDPDGLLQPPSLMFTSSNFDSFEYWLQAPEMKRLGKFLQLPLLDVHC